MQAHLGARGRRIGGRPYPRLQILTLAELFQGKKPQIPFVDPASVKRAKREETGRQDRLL
jgi:site-specific DNA-methyltransferase (adenine-specific)